MQRNDVVSRYAQALSAIEDAIEKLEWGDETEALSFLQAELKWQNKMIRQEIRSSKEEVKTNVQTY